MNAISAYARPGLTNVLFVPQPRPGDDVFGAGRVPGESESEHAASLLRVARLGVENARRRLGEANRTGTDTVRFDREQMRRRRSRAMRALNAARASVRYGERRLLELMQAEPSVCALLRAA